MLKKLWPFIKQIVSSYSEDRIAGLSASLSYYTLCSLTSILFITISLLGLALGLEEIKSQFLQQISDLMDPETSQRIQMMIESANKPSTVLLSQIGGHITFYHLPWGSFY